MVTAALSGQHFYSDLRCEVGHSKWCAYVLLWVVMVLSKGLCGE